MAIDQEYFDKLASTLIEGEEEECLELIEAGLKEGMNPLEAIEKGLGKGMKNLGDDYAAGEAFLPELVMAADIMKAGLERLDAAMKESGTDRQTMGRVVIGTIKGDVHDIGKSVVAAVMQANGYDVIDLGIDVAPEDFVKTIKEENCNVLGMSTLLTLPLMVMGETIEMLKKEGLRDKVKVIVGGCPVTQEFADEIGADAVGFDAMDGLRKLDKVMNVKR